MRLKPIAAPRLYQRIAEELVRPTEIAVLAEPAILEVVRLDGEAGGNMFGHAVEPLVLLV